jgi:hypothetical protein
VVLILLRVLLRSVCAPAAAIEQLRRIAEQYISLADSSLPAHAHLEAGDRDTLRKEAGAALEWLNEKVALQAQVGLEHGAGRAPVHLCYMCHLC